MLGLDWNEFILNPLTPVTGVPSKYTNPFNAVPGLNWDNVADNINLDPKDIVSEITDTAGLTDTGAGQRGLEALQSGAEAATKALDTDMAPVFNMYEKAKSGRGMKNVLDTYRTGMMGTENAAGAENVQQFLNPMYDRAIENATNQALAGAGSSLQSSAANQAVGTAVGNQVQNMWNQAFQNAMADAQNKQGIYGKVMQSDLMPSLNWAQLTSDVAGTKYTTGMDLAQAAGQVAGRNQSITANMF